MTTPLDILIVGARPAGTTLARLLATRGCRVLVCDRGTPEADTLSTHALMRGAVVHLHRHGLLPRVIETGTPPITRTTFRYGATTTSIDIEPRDGVDALYAPRRHVLDPLLAHAARDAGAQVRYQTRVMALTRDARGAVSGAVVADAAGRHEMIAAALVVGADGRHSTVARLAGAPIVRQDAACAGVVYAHWPGLGGHEYRWAFAPQISAGAIPTNGGSCVFVTVPDAHFRPRFHGRLDAGYREALHTIAPDLAARLPQTLPPEGYRGFGGQPGRWHRSHGPGWCLVGDALAFRDPITAHGITDALRDAEALAGAILDGRPQAWRAFDDEHAALAGPIADLTDRIASFDWTLDELQELHRALSRAMNRASRRPAESR